MISRSHARKAFGHDCIDADEVAKFFALTLSDDDQRALADVLFSRAVLSESHDTHYLLPGIALSLIDIRRRLDATHLSAHGWEKHRFASSERVHRGWFLVPKVVERYRMPAGHAFAAPAFIFAHAARLPYACEAAYAIVLCRCLRGDILFQNCSLLTGTLVCNGKHAVSINHLAFDLQLRGGWALDVRI